MTISFTVEAWPVAAIVLGLLIIAPIVQHFLKKRSNNGGE